MNLSLTPTAFNSSTSPASPDVKDKLEAEFKMSICFLLC